MISNCPACGAPLSVEGSTAHTTCPFCGNSFKVEMGGVQPALEKTDAAQVSSFKPASENIDLPAYEPPSADLPQIDTDPLYNPPIESSPYPQSTATSSPHIPFPRQTYDTARQTASTVYGNIASKGKSFLVGALLLMLALVGGCCFCLVMAFKQIFGI